MVGRWGWGGWLRRTEEEHVRYLFEGERLTDFAGESDVEWEE